MKDITFNQDLCKGCELCVGVCPKKIVVIDKEKINLKGYNPANVIEKDKCISCGQCALICPDVVIKIEK